MNVILFELLPYGAAAVALVESLRRYLKSRFTYSSLSSQFLERDHLFFASAPWHYSILLLLLGHLLVFVFPKSVLALNSVPARLYALEVAALACGLTALVGLLNLALRRVLSPRVRAVTSPMDVVILLVLLVQVATGVSNAVTLRWGANWFAAVLTPYLRSLVTFRPDASALSLLPLTVQLHVLGAFVLLALLPFSRLVHMLALPWQYLWSRPQRVIWNRQPRPLQPGMDR